MNLPNFSSICLRFFAAEIEPCKTADFNPLDARVYDIEDRLFTAGVRTPGLPIYKAILGIKGTESRNLLSINVLQPTENQ